MDTAKVPSVAKRPGVKSKGQEAPSGNVNVGNKAISVPSFSSASLEGDGTISDPVENIIRAVVQIKTENIKFKHQFGLAQQLIAELNAEIDAQKVKLIEAQKLIADQNAEIDAQKVELIEARELIADQKRKLELATGNKLEAAEEFAKLEKPLKGFLNDEFLHLFENVKELLMDKQDQESISVRTVQKIKEDNGELRMDDLLELLEFPSFLDQISSPTKRPSPPPLSDDSNDSIQFIGENETSEKSTEPLILSNAGAGPSVLKSTEDEDSSNVYGVGLARKKSVKENELPLLPNPSTEEFRKSGLLVKKPSKDVIRSLKKQDDDQNSIASPLMEQQPQHFRMNLLDFIGDDDKKMGNNRRRMAVHSPPSSAPAPPLSANEIEKMNEKTVKPMVVVPKQDTGFYCTCHEREFKSEQDLKVHIHRHSGIYKCLCPRCEKPFFHKSHLNSHMRTHEMSDQVPSGAKRQKHGVLNAEQVSKRSRTHD